MNTICIENQNHSVLLIPTAEGFSGVFCQNKILRPSNSRGYSKSLWERKFKTETGARRWAARMLRENV